MQKILALSLLFALSCHAQLAPGVIPPGDTILINGPTNLAAFAVTNDDSHPNTYALFDSAGSNLTISVMARPPAMQVFDANETNIAAHPKRLLPKPILNCTLDPGQMAIVRQTTHIRHGVRVLSSGYATFGPITLSTNQ
jgi:hypothetical protein